MINLTKNDNNVRCNELKVKWLNCEKVKFKSLLVRTLSEHCSSSLFWLNFCLLTHAIQILRIFGALFIFDISLFAQCNVNIKHSYRQMSEKADTCMAKTTNGMKYQVFRVKLSLINFSF